MDTKTDDRIAAIREAFDRLADAMSTDRDGVMDLLPYPCRDAWDELLEAIEEAEDKR